jgi:hypothetical protein
VVKFEVAIKEPEPEEQKVVRLEFETEGSTIHVKADEGFYLVSFTPEGLELWSGLEGGIDGLPLDKKGYLKVKRI